MARYWALFIILPVDERIGIREVRSKYKKVSIRNLQLMADMISHFFIMRVSADMFAFGKSSGGKN